MIIIKVLVDEMPSGCKRCGYCVAKMYCLLLEDRKTTVPDEPYKRRPDCPLVYDFSDKQINDLTARIAELEAAQRWRVVANGELPEDGEVVWLWDGNNLGMGYYLVFSGQFMDRYTPLRPIRPSHWLPLPESPEVQK